MTNKPTVSGDYKVNTGVASPLRSAALISAFFTKYFDEIFEVIQEDYSKGLPYIRYIRGWSDDAVAKALNIKTSTVSNTRLQAYGILEKSYRMGQEKPSYATISAVKYL